MQIYKLLKNSVCFYIILQNFKITLYHFKYFNEMYNFFNLTHFYVSLQNLYAILPLLRRFIIILGNLVKLGLISHNFLHYKISPNNAMVQNLT